MEKTLIVLLGNARGGEDTWETMYKNLRDPYNADIALCFGETSDKSSSLYRNAKYVWELKEYDDWMDYYEPHFGIDWFEPLAAKHRVTGVLGGIRKLQGSGGIIFAFRHFLLKNYKHILQEYDRIIMTRSDYYYIDKHPVLPNDSFYIVEGQDWGGICDRHHIFNKDMIDDVLGICEYLCNKEHASTLCSVDLNPEKALLLFFENSGIAKKIKRSKRVQFTVIDTNDTTRWKGPGRQLPGHPTLRLKYEQEYDDAIANFYTSNVITNLGTSLE